MSTSSQTYKELSIPYFKEVFDIIDDVLVRNKAPYYLIGATALALELLKEGIKPSRGTKDIDFAVMVASQKDYNNLLEDLLNKGFSKAKDPFTLYHSKYDVAVDLLPFGQIKEDDTASFNDRDVDFHAYIGLEEVLSDPHEVLIEDKVVKIPPLIGVVILKLISWNDRPEIRADDLGDIFKIIENYYDFEWDYLLEVHSDLLDLATFDQLKVASRLLGRDARKYMQMSGVLSEKISELLSTQLSDPTSSGIARKWASLKGIEVQEAFEILLEFQKGIKE